MATTGKDTDASISDNSKKQNEKSAEDNASKDAAPKATGGPGEVNNHEASGASRDPPIEERDDKKNDGDGAVEEDNDAFMSAGEEEEEDHDGMDDDEGEAGPKKAGKKKEGKSITRIRYSNDFKIKVLDELQVTNYTVAEMARRHKLPEATLRDWVKTKDKITTAQVNRRGSAKSNSRDNLQKVTDALRQFMDLNDRLGACGMSKLPITNAMIAKQGQEVKSLLLEKDAKKPFLTPQERKTMNVSPKTIYVLYCMIYDVPLFPANVRRG